MKQRATKLIKGQRELE